MARSLDDPLADARSARGRAGELAARRLYERRGFRVLAHNWRCALGEIDLVLERAGLLVVCEVKTRSGPAFGGGYEAVTWSKRRKLRQLADAFVIATRSRHASVRFDVASVWLEGARPDVEVFEDAF